MNINLIYKEKIMSEQKMRILKTGECLSLSGKSTLTYRIGCNNDNEIFIKLAGNSGGGHFSPDWVSLEEIYTVLASQKKPITSGALHELYQGKSSNNASFTTDVLLKEGLLKARDRHYDLLGQAEFGKIAQALLEAASEEKPARKRSGKKKVAK
jgi:hypothetical protein